MEFNRQDLTFTYNADGYMLTYKGQNIGGAGVKLPREKRLSPKQRQDNLKDFKESAERDLDALASGRGQARYIEAIKTIDAKAA